MEKERSINRQEAEKIARQITKDTQQEETFGGEQEQTPMA